MRYPPNPYLTKMTYMPPFEKRRALICAERKAENAVNGLPDCSATIALFWIAHDFEYRQYIERWLNNHADVQKG